MERGQGDNPANDSGTYGTCKGGNGLASCEHAGDVVRLAIAGVVGDRCAVNTLDQAAHGAVRDSRSVRRGGSSRNGGTDEKAVDLPHQHVVVPQAHVASLVVSNKARAGNPLRD